MQPFSLRSAIGGRIRRGALPQHMEVGWKPTPDDSGQAQSA